ncbi:hypothetical protein KIH74_27105 [Kineosporia sp. J2-2]|uniref:Uncharacterized protein n=1 Tax=Kineosporia corallincola TaxID=2835133 RepID=A0ABS5TNF4_9ACTN|nr:hypothetical protein [Kineosporia corallincola]MBT0772642.1 hypothetical protein [Kineosporia corallincola]
MGARNRHARSDAGAATLEQVGLVSAVAVVIGAVALAMAPQRIASEATRAVCLAFTLGQADCGSGATDDVVTDESFKPTECRVREQTEKVGTVIDIGFVSMGKEYGFARQEMADGKVQLTAVGTDSVGVTGGPDGKTFDIGRIGSEVGELEGEGSGTFKIGYGDTWEFDSAAEADQFQDDINEYASMKSWESGPDGLGYIIMNKITGYPEVPQPTTRITKMSGDAGIQAGLQVKLQDVPTTSGADADAEEPEGLDPNVGGTLEIKGEYEVTQETKTNGDNSWTYQLSGELKGEASVVAVGGEASGKSTGAFKVTRDKDGNLTELSFVSTREGTLQANTGAKAATADGEATGKDGSAFTTATVTTTTLKLDDAADRKIAQDWLSGNNEQFGSPFELTYDTMVPSKEAAADDLFGQLMYGKGTVSQVQYEGVKNVEEFGAEINLGWKFGAKISSENGSNQTVNATYLGAPTTDGTRPMLQYSECQ